MLVRGRSIEAARLRREALAFKARRLHYKADHRPVYVIELDDRHFHTFLSHVWGTGQDQMRVVKERLVEMIPDLHVFLDVDDLTEGNIEGYIEPTTTILVYCTKGYFTSKNCIRELVASTAMRKPIIPLIDLDESHGGLSLEEVRRQLVEADARHAYWGFRTQESNQEGPIWPGSDALHKHLFDGEPIEWNRIGHFQDVSMRLIAERILDHSLGDPLKTVAGTTYIPGSLLAQKVDQLGPPGGQFHLCCSELNPGALNLIEELCTCCGMSLKVNVIPETNHDLCITTNVDQVGMCDQMLVYLTAQTWTRGQDSEAFGAEVMKAMDNGTRLLLAHEMPGMGQDARYGVEFSSFFSSADGATPSSLLARGIYGQIAVPLKGGEWREVSIRLVAKSVLLR